VIAAFLVKYGSEDARRQYFKARQNLFTRLNPVWRRIEDAVQFWEEMEPFSTELAQVALRVFHTLSNSVPSERSFSTRYLMPFLQQTQC
jgi:hypothetical protein